MHRLRTAELRALLTFHDRTLRVHEDSQLPGLLEDLARLVGCDTASLTRLDARQQSALVLHWPTGRPRDVTEEMSLRLPGGAHLHQTITLTLSRGRFTDTQRELLTASGPHLAAATSRVRHHRHRVLHSVPSSPAIEPEYASGPRRPTADAPTSTGPAIASLSGRERQVLALVAEGLTDAQVARRLGLRPATVSKHLSRVYARLGVANRAAAVQALACPCTLTPAPHVQPGRTG